MTTSGAMSRITQTTIVVMAPPIAPAATFRTGAADADRGRDARSVLTAISHLLVAAAQLPRAAPPGGARPPAALRRPAPSDTVINAAPRPIREAGGPLPGEPDRLGHEADERRGGPARPGVAVEEARPARLRLGERRRDEEVLALQVVDERVVGVVAARGPHQPLAPLGQDRADGRRGDQPPPRVRPGHDGRAHPVQLGRARVPQAGRGG